MLTRFIIKNIVFTGFIALALYGGVLFMDLELLVPETWLLLGFFFLINHLSYWLMFKAVGERPALMVRQFMLSTVIRFFLYIGGIMAYTFTFRDQAKTFVVTFIIGYFIFLIFEVIILMNLVQKDNNSD